MRIGVLAKKAGVHVETIRYYQKIGLMPKPGPVRGLMRRYGSEALSRLQFIRRAQRLGFSLDEVKALVQLSHAGDCSEVRALARQKVARLENRVHRLQQMLMALNRLIDACGSRGSGQDCPIVAALSAADPSALTQALDGRGEHLFIPSLPE